MAEQLPETPPRLAAEDTRRDDRGGCGVLPRGLLLAIQFLTALPVRVRAAVPVEDDAAPVMAAALPWFPLIGAALGGLTALVDWALSPVFGVGVRDVFLLALPLLLTGMLHADGFVDCCDALLGTRSVERRLEILRDSRVGAYGALGGALLLIARYAALGALAGPARPLALIAAPLLGRWGIVYAVTRYRYARAAGLGARFRARRGHLIGTSAVALALLVAVGAGIAVAARVDAPPPLALLALLALAAIAVAAGWCAWASRRLGDGLTGDTYGALNELAELAVLLLAVPLSAVLLLGPQLCGGTLCR